MQSSLVLMRHLANSILANVDIIEKKCTNDGLVFPSLDDLLYDNPQSEGTKGVPAIACAIDTIVAATSQLSALVQPSHTFALTLALQHNLTHSLNVAEHLNVAEILRKAGPQGLHVKDIAAYSGTSAKKLAPMLRILATEHMFKEISPDVFANNRLSSMLDSGKSIETLTDGSHVKFSGACEALPALIAQQGNQAGYAPAPRGLAEYMANPELANTFEPTRAPFNVAMKTDGTYFDFLSRPENAALLEQFGIAMKGQPDRVQDGFDWKALKSGSTVVDVGGGVGAAMLSIAAARDDLKIIIQDLPMSAEDAQKFWDIHNAEAMKSGRVVFQGIDFFKPQAVKAADVFFLRSVLHDWSDGYCVDILKQLREAAGPSTKLVIVDHVLGYAIEEDDSKLLQNRGHASLLGHLFGLEMMKLINAQERTRLEFEDILGRSGWVWESVKRPDGSPQSFIVAVPV